LLVQRQRLLELTGHPQVFGEVHRARERVRMLLAE
jgi:hypothetical protein